MMRQLIISAITTALFAFSAPTFADKDKATEAKEGHAHAGKATTVKGEIVDLGCYLAHASKGAAHKSCAIKCINDGMPMGVLTTNGKLYLLTLSHEDSDPFNQAKKFAGETVEITGPMNERSGIKSIEVTAVGVIPIAAPPAAASGSGK